MLDHLVSLLLLFVQIIIELKKPAGTAEEIENNFGCESSRLIMVRSRLVIDFSSLSRYFSYA